MKRVLRLTAIVGAASAVGLTVIGLIDIRSALSGWLAGFALWSGVPLGALLLAMMAAVIPGRWREEVAAPAAALVALMPMVGIAVLPVLIGIEALYSWSAESGNFYLSTGFFAIRSIVFVAALIGLGGLLMVRPVWALPVAAGGLILFVLLDTTLAVDWLMSLEPHFHSSGFGLYVLSIQADVVVAVILLIRIRVPDARPGLLGALMLTTLLCWAYLAFMQYVISWSDNLPEPVKWYQHRGTGIWSAAEYAIGALGLVPLVLLFLTPIRIHRAWLRGIAGAVLLGKAIEIAWLVFPATGTAPWLGIVNELLALFVLSALSVGFFAWIAQARAVRARGRAS